MGVQFHCMIEKASVEEEKMSFSHTSILRHSTSSHISGNRGYDSNRVRFSAFFSNEQFILSLPSKGNILSVEVCTCSLSENDILSD